MASWYISEPIADLDSIVTMPVVMDLDAEGQRVLGDPEPTFPRNLVLDKDGTIYHHDTNLSLDATEAALEALFSE